MALSKVDFNNINVTPAASKALKWNSSANGFETGDLGGSMVLLSTVTASSSATIEFTSGIDSTYKEYQFHYTDMHPATDNQSLLVLFRDGSSAFDATVTSSAFEAYHNEADDASGLAYNTGFDLAQGTGGQELLEQQGNDNDQCAAGILHLFDPSSTTFVKHFISRSRQTHYADYMSDGFVAGYCNVTAAIDGVQFKFASGNIDAGTIKMYGVS
jgi:hypothetical protein